MQLEAFSISGLKKITPARFGDSRGYFSEVFKREWFRENVADVEFVQDNESLSAQAGTVRGLHFQTEPFAQGKLVRCIRAGCWMSRWISEQDRPPSDNGRLSNSHPKMASSCGFRRDLPTVS